MKRLHKVLNSWFSDNFPETAKEIMAGLDQEGGHRCGCRTISKALWNVFDSGYKICTILMQIITLLINYMLP
jgi:hypothetical protein